MSKETFEVDEDIDIGEEQDMQENKQQTIGIKRSRINAFFRESPNSDTDEETIETIEYQGPCTINAEEQFTMLYATVYRATMTGLQGLAPIFAVPIMRYIIPECGCYIECWEQRWSEWDLLPDLSAESLIAIMTLNRLRLLPNFEQDLEDASAAFTHLHDDPDEPNGKLGTTGSWQPLGGMHHDSPIQSDEDVCVNAGSKNTASRSNEDV